MSKRRDFRNRQRSNYSRKHKVKNAMLTGGGAATLQDRGSTQQGDNVTLNPYYYNNYIGRYQEYIRWYMTA